MRSGVLSEFFPAWHFSCSFSQPACFFFCSLKVLRPFILQPVDTIGPVRGSTSCFFVPRWTPCTARHPQSLRIGPVPTVNFSLSHSPLLVPRLRLSTLTRSLPLSSVRFRSIVLNSGRLCFVLITRFWLKTVLHAIQAAQC